MKTGVFPERTHFSGRIPIFYVENPISLEQLRIFHVGTPFHLKRNPFPKECARLMDNAYWIGEEYWGKGYGTGAAKAMIDFAFMEKKYHKVFARYFKSNPASGRIMQKVGMVQEGLLKDHLVKDDKYEDLIY